MGDENGVTITTREIYESVNNLTREVTQLGSRFERLESKISDQSELSHEAKERSHKALNLANDANTNAIEASKDAQSALKKFNEMEKERYKEQISTNEKEKETKNKFYVAILSACIPWLITLIIGIIYIAKNNGF